MCLLYLALYAHMDHLWRKFPCFTSNIPNCSWQRHFSPQISQENVVLWQPFSHNSWEKWQKAVEIEHQLRQNFGFHHSLTPPSRRLRHMYVREVVGFGYILTARQITSSLTVEELARDLSSPAKQLKNPVNKTELNSIKILLHTKIKT